MVYLGGINCIVHDLNPAFKRCLGQSIALVKLNSSLFQVSGGSFRLILTVLFKIVLQLSNLIFFNQATELIAN